MKNLFANLYLHNRFFWMYGGIIFIFANSFFVPWLFPVAQTLLFVSFSVILLDGILLFQLPFRVNCNRLLPGLFNLGDENQVTIKVHNAASMPLKLVIIDEIPYQLQLRNFYFKIKLQPNQKHTLHYQIRPTQRGSYQFNNIRVYACTPIGLLQRHYCFEGTRKVPVYPSINQMKNYEIKAFERISNFQGIKKIRRLGHNYEFEQIKSYVKGDDYRSINWKATSRRGDLMVNQYEDEKAQPVYSIIDKSRIMKMPFQQMTLLDYAINTSLVISNLALQKHDKAGLITFSNKIESTLVAESGRRQLKAILETLYKQKTDQNIDADHELLYANVRRKVPTRSLIFLFTNFESIYAMERALPMLRKLNKLHLLVVVFFENTELIDFTRKPADSIEDIYYRTIAEKFVAEKETIVHELNKYGIQSILTNPQALSVNTINKYLELKAKGMI